MKYIASNNKFFKFSPLSVAFATALSFAHINTVQAEFIPDGFFLLPNGKIMAENPDTAKAPDGYHLRPNGILLRIDFDDKEESNPIDFNNNAMAKDVIPPGFHLMGDGTFMANNPKTAVAPAGYHIMPDGTLMTTSGGGSHHSKGMWMFDYKFSQMNMKNLIDSATKISAQDAIDPNNIYQYMMAPSDMTMNMHMGMLMYGFSHKFMGMVMVHYMDNSMDMLSSDGTRSTMTSSGFGDTVFSGLFKGPHHLNFRLGLSIPTGSVNERGPMTHNASFTQADVKYPYAMQLGSGSYELKQGAEYSDAINTVSWGINYELTARLNQNKFDYKLGNLLELEGWSQWDIVPMLSLATNVTLYSQGQTTGADVDIPSTLVTMSPSFNSVNYGGNRIDVGGSAIFNFPGDTYSLTASFAVPVHQTLWGPQMAVASIMSINFGVMW